MPGGLCPSESSQKGVVMPNSQQRLWFALCVASGLFAASAAPSRLLAQGGEPKYFAIRGATVVPVSGPRLENTTIVIARGVISAIGKDAAIPDEASVIDGKGLTVYPGLVDSFTDVGIPPVPTAASEGGQHTQQSVSRGPEDRPGASPWRTAAEEVNLSDKRVETWRAAGFTTVISAPKGGMFPGQAAVLDLAGERNGVIYGGQMGYEVADEIAAKKVPVLVDLKWPEAEKGSDPDDTPSLRTLRFRERAPSAPAALAKAGVKFAFYSGSITAPKDMLKAVKKSMDAGLTEDAAVRALSLTPAEIFGVADRLGSIEKGKIANLIIADGDLFNEKTKIKAVFVDGTHFEIREPEKPKDAPKGDLSGKWKLSYTTPEGSEESTLDLSMASDGALSG